MASHHAMRALIVQGVNIVKQVVRVGFAVQKVKAITINLLPQKNKSYVGQCKALTKKGTRCKRNGDGSGYCWQHDK